MTIAGCQYPAEAGSRMGLDAALQTASWIAGTPEPWYVFDSPAAVLA